MSSKPGKIKILLHGEQYHAKVFSKQLENYKKGLFEPKYCEILDKEINYNEFDLIHLISSPLAEIKKIKIKKPIIYHWIGTDVYRFLNDSFVRRSLKKFLIKSARIINVVVSENLKNELAQLGLSSTILPLVKLDFTNEIPPMPGKFSVLTYVPEKRWDFYRGDLILRLAEKMPDVEFHIVAAEKRDTKLPNVFNYNFIEDLVPFYKKTSVLLRLTIHDGLPKMVLEALSYGRNVLWSESFPYSYMVKNIDDCLNVLNNLKSKSTVNKEGKEFIERTYNPEKILDDYLNFCFKLLDMKK